MNSKRKGAVGEREIAQYLREHGFTEAKRGVQYQGSPDSPDVTGLTGFHIEVKRVEKLELDKALAQSIRDAGADEIPVVFHRKNRTKWKCTLLLDDFMKIIEKSVHLEQNEQIQRDHARKVIEEMEKRRQL